MNLTMIKRVELVRDWWIFISILFEYSKIQLLILRQSEIIYIELFIINESIKYDLSWQTHNFILNLSIQIYTHNYYTYLRIALLNTIIIYLLMQDFD